MARTRSQLNAESGDGDASTNVPSQRVVKRYVGSLEKKRARDRRAQQVMRAKRESQVHALEDKIATLELELQRSRTNCEVLHHQNRVLHSRQDSICRLVTSWCQPPKPLTPGGGDSGATPFVLALEQCLQDPSSSSSNSSATSSLDSGTALVEARDNALFPATTPLCTSASAIPTRPHPDADVVRSCVDLWNATPTHSGLDVIVTDQFSRWLHHPELVHQSPDNPSPVEIIHGSEKNFLANVISEATQKWPCRDPERLAGGWLTYHFIKWMLRPNQERYFRLQTFQKPVLEQMSQPHPYFVDFLFWPRMRANLVKYQHLYDPVEVMSLMTCCVKVRWPWRKPFLQSDKEGVVQFHPEFYDTFTKLEGWGVTDDFINRFPELVEGLDMNSVRFGFDT